MVCACCVCMCTYMHVYIQTPLLTHFPVQGHMVAVLDRD